jgi:hypothetical protein
VRFRVTTPFEDSGRATLIVKVIHARALSAGAAAKLSEQAAKEITWAQQRNAQARTSHAKTQRRKLRKLGIKLTQIQRVPWNTS